MLTYPPKSTQVACKIESFVIILVISIELIDKIFFGVENSKELWFFPSQDPNLGLFLVKVFN